MIGMLPYKEELRKKMVTDRIKDRITFVGAYFPKAIGKRSVKHRHHGTERRNGMGIKRGTEWRNGMGIKRGREPNGDKTRNVG